MTMELFSLLLWCLPYVHGVLLTVCSSRLEDSSEQVKKELARIIGQLSCIQSELSQLSDTRRESTRPSEILCHQLSLATEHAGSTCPSLRTTVFRPFLPLLSQKAPSSVKQGISFFVFDVFFHNELLQHADSLNDTTLL